MRGAYHPHEISAHTALHSPSTKSSSASKSHTLSISPDELPPVWYTKDETDACYNKCVDILLDAMAADVALPSARSSWFGFGSKPNQLKVPTVGILFGTHNWGSVRLILDRLVQKGLARTEGVTPEGESIVRIGSEVTERVTMGQLYGKVLFPLPRLCSVADESGRYA